MTLEGKKVLVTGADGFIGSHLVERLVVEGASVRAFCMYNSEGSPGWLRDIAVDALAEVDTRFGDIRDARLVEHAVRGVEAVFHLAALIAIPYSYLAPSSYVDTNVTGTLNVLEASRRHSVGIVLHTSTSEVYGNAPTLPITEETPLRAQSPYSATKIAADKLAEAYALSYGLGVTILRPFNTYGPRQSLRAVIPTILSQLLTGSSCVRVGSTHPRRDFTYVTDTADAFVRATNAQLEKGAVVQLGTGSAVSVIELFELCREIVGSDASLESDVTRVRPSSSEIDVLLSNPERARRILGWRPTVDLRDGIVRTTEWLRPRVDRVAAQSYVR